MTKQFRVEQNRTGMVGQPLHLLHEEGAETVSCCWEILQQPAKSNSSRFISCALMPRLAALLWVFMSNAMLALLQAEPACTLPS